MRYLCFVKMDETLANPPQALMEAMGGKGKYAIVSCGQTAENLNSWIAVQKAYTAQKYPNAQIVDIVYGLVAVTILVQGLALGPIMRRLPLAA